MPGDPFAYRRRFGHQDRLRMAVLYRDERWTLAEIAKEFGCRAETVGKYLRDMGVEMRQAARRLRIDLPPSA